MPKKQSALNSSDVSKSQKRKLPPHPYAGVKKHKKKKISNVEEKKKKSGKHIGFMCPNFPALDHPMSNLLLLHVE